MKIVLFIENQRFGGMDTFVINLIKSWPDKNDSFLVICNHDHPGLTYLSNNLKVEIIEHDIPLGWSILSNIINSLPSFLKRIFRQILKLLLIPYQYSQIKKILKNIDGDALIAVNGAYPGGETCRIANIVWNGLGKENSIHNIHNYAIKSRLIIRPIENIIDQKLSASVTSIVCVSNDCANSLKVRENINQGKIKVIRNGIELININNSAYSLRDMLKISPNHKIITMIGTYERRKGHKFLFKSMQKVYDNYENITLVVIGSGAPHEIIRVNSLVDKYLKNRNVHLVGELEDAASYLRDSDLLVIPSQSYESFGLTAIEAMQNYNAVVTTDVGGLPETLGENGECGFYVDREDYIEFAQKILYIISNNEVLYRMGQNGHKRASRYFSSSEMCRNYHDLLKQR